MLICFCHFELAFPSYWHTWLLKFGELGVFSFFLISGYIIPRIMSKEQYRLPKFGTFMARRLARLHPPYVAALALTLVASAAAAAWKEEPMRWDGSDLLPYFLYLAWPAENPVFWTLGVEMCFYIFIALTFNLFNARSQGLRWATFLAASSLWLLRGELLFFHLIAFFLLGVALEQHQRGIVGRGEFAVKAALTCALVWLTPGLEDVPLGPFSVVACLAICVFIVAPPPLPGAAPFLWLGAMSYPLYLVHFPFGVKLINLALKMAPGVPPFLVGLVAIMCSVLLAWLIHRFVERPAMAWAGTIGNARPPGRRAS